MIRAFLIIKSRFYGWKDGHGRPVQEMVLSLGPGEAGQREKRVMYQYDLRRPGFCQL